MPLSLFGENLFGQVPNNGPRTGTVSLISVHTCIILFLHFFQRILPPFFGHVYCLLLSFHFHFFPDSNVLFFTLKRILSLYKSPKIAPTLTNEAFTYLFNWRSWKRRWMRTMWWATSRTMGDQLADVTLKFCQILEIFSSWKEIIIGKSGTEAVQILLHRNWLVLFSADLLSWPPTCIMNSCSMLLMMKELLGLWVEEDQKNLMNYMN